MTDSEMQKLRSEVEVLKRELRRIKQDLADEDEELVDNCSISSPDTLGAASEGSETADSGTWTRDGSTPLEFYVQSRSGYFESGNETLYQYLRKVTIDACGKIVSVGAETRVTVDVPEDC